MEEQQHGQDALLEHGGSRVRFQSLSPSRGRGGAIRAWRPVVQIPLGDTRLWSAATAAGPAREGSRCPCAPPHTARSPKTWPSCLKKPRRLELGVLPNVCLTAKPSERLRGAGSLSPRLLARSVCCCQSRGTSACLFCSSNSHACRHAGSSEGWSSRGLTQQICLHGVQTARARHKPNPRTSGASSPAWKGTLPSMESQGS